jgi:hypothetical protein
MRKLENAGRALWAASLAVAAVACGSKSGGAPLSLSASTSQAVTSTPPSTSTSLDLGNGIMLDRVRVVVRKVKLELDPTGAGSTTTTSMPPAIGGKTKMEGEPDDPNEPTFGPILVDLSGATVAGGIEQVVAGLVPEGTFHEAKIAIGPVTADQAGTNPKLAEMAARNASIIIDGTVDGTAFTFVSSLVAEIDVESDFVVGGSKTNNITLEVNLKGCFGGTGTSRLDPVPANQSAIENLIKAAITAFEDDDMNGHEDTGGKSAPTAK